MAPLPALQSLMENHQRVSSDTTYFAIYKEYAVSLIKSSQDLHLMVRKGSGLELFGSTETLPYSSMPLSSLKLSTHVFTAARHCPVQHCHMYSQQHATVQSKTAKHVFTARHCPHMCSQHVTVHTYVHSSMPLSRNGLSNGHHHTEEEHNGWGDVASPGTSEGSSVAESEKDFSLLEVEQLKEDHTRTILVPGDDILVHHPPPPPSPPPAPTNGFLLELQKRAEKMKTKKSSEWCEAANGMSQHVAKHACNEKNQEELMKRKQHELMMEEIHKVHRKMFNRQQNGSICTEPECPEATECPPPCCPPPPKPAPIVTIGSYQSQPSRFEARTTPQGDRGPVPARLPVIVLGVLYRLSGPLEETSASSPAQVSYILIHLMNGSSSSHGDLIQVHIAVNGATSLGCSIVKGPPEVPGIFFSMIKPHGLAEQAGLCVGDQIISMNRTSFIDIEFAEVAAVDISVSGLMGQVVTLRLTKAVSLIKSSQDLHLMVRKGSGLELFGSTETLPYRNGLSNGHHHTEEEHNGWGDVASPGTSEGSSVAESEKDFSLLEVEQLKEDHTRTILVPGDDILVHHPPPPPSPPPAPTNGFLLELQKRAEKMKTKKSSEWCEAANGMSQHVAKHACNEKNQEELMKRKQHELMMEEIHKVHRKMFNRQQNGSICTEPECPEATECPPPCCPPPPKPAPIVTIGSYQSQPSRFEARTTPREIVVQSPHGSLSSSSGSSTGSRGRWRKPPPPPPPKSARPPSVNASAFVIKTGSTTQWQADLAPKEIAASDMRNRRHVQLLLTWSTNAAHLVSLD
ncbi:USH1C [Cordylochernes scorpioides]|uniref:USH1C n=1 Tax=Cordylochernes scorpioides TaxID=51811 RepID=A0ABY6KXP1_9ARAC|nr:USH1C [Cordylochernes scorpioides]